MGPNEAQESTFLDQILDQVFDTLSYNDNFDNATLVRLRELDNSNQLGDFEKVVAALTTEVEA